MSLKIKNFFAVALILLSISFFSCSDNTTTPTPQSGSTKIAVISDLHIMDATLGTTGTAFENYLVNDRKMLAESDAIIQSLVNSLIASDAKIILVPGDLAKDGEKICHQKMAGYFQQLENAGKKVYVVPGNHDIKNQESFSYSGANTTKVDNVTVDEFKSIYNEFGFKEAIASDPNSLTYVVEPVKDLWIICMDDCKYKEITDSNLVDGAFSTETLNWIKAKITEGKNSGKTILGMVHHGVLEHFSGQKSNPISMDYVMDNWEQISTDFADLGMSVVFTGHFHTNDIVKKTTATNNFIFDIETGSPLTSPCPYRYVTLSSDKKLTITTSYVTNITYDLGGKTFQTYATDFFNTKMGIYVHNEIVNTYGKSEQEAQMLTPVVVAAFAAHYAGDEVMPPSVVPVIQQLMGSGDPTAMFMGQTIQSLFTDLPPKDNNITINLKDGTVVE
jgi:3',5'-cyclic AMP phosphodiesterase CpdA